MRVRAEASFAAALLLSGFLAIHLSAELQKNALGEATTDPLTHFLGSAKEAIGDKLLLKADAYLHGGVEAEHDEPLEDDEKAREEVAHQKPRDWIARVNAVVREHRHEHLKKEELKELVPLLALAVELDPHNVTGVLSTGYWLERQLDRPKEAAEVLEKGAVDNPESWEIEQALGELRFRQKDYPAAGFHLEKALKKSASVDLNRSSKSLMLYHLGESRRLAGSREGALEAYRQALALYGPQDDLPIKQKLASLIESLSTPPSP